jgi:hypothetical protein
MPHPRRLTAYDLPVFPLLRGDTLQGAFNFNSGVVRPTNGLRCFG